MGNLKGKLTVFVTLAAPNQGTLSPSPVQDYFPTSELLFLKSLVSEHPIHVLACKSVCRHVVISSPVKPMHPEVGIRFQGRQHEQHEACDVVSGLPLFEP